MAKQIRLPLALAKNRTTGQVAGFPLLDEEGRPAGRIDQGEWEETGETVMVGTEVDVLDDDGKHTVRCFADGRSFTTTRTAVGDPPPPLAPDAPPDAT